MEESQVGIAIIGCGYWGVNYVRVFNELPQSWVAVVCDQRVERLREIRHRFPSVEFTKNLSDVLCRSSVDAVIVSTGAATHYRIAQQCLEAGKHVMVEKPMTITTADGEDLIQQAKAKGLTLMVGHTFLYNAAVRKVKDYLKDIGQVYYLYARHTNLGPIRTDVNALWDLAPHDISIFNYWLGSEPQWVSAVGARVLHNGHEDVGFISLGYPASVVAHIHVSWADPNKVREFVVVGSHERIVLNDLNVLEPVRVFEKGVAPIKQEAASYGEYQFAIREGDIISPRVEVSEPLKNECLHFLECVTHGKRPFTDGNDGLAVVRVMEAIDRSVECNGAPVEVARTDLARANLARTDLLRVELTGAELAHATVRRNSRGHLPQRHTHPVR